MTSAAADFDLLLQDARLVVEYASRAGRLPDDALPKAIEAAERALAAGEKPDRVSLLSALNNAVRGMAPVTLIDLREGRSPYDIGSQRYASRLVILLCLFSIVLTGLIAFYTNALYQADSALAAIHQIEKVRYVDKVREVRRLTQDKELFVKHDARYAHYHQQLGELAFARAEHNAAVSLIVASSTSVMFPGASFFSSLWNVVTPAVHSPAAQEGSSPGEAAPITELKATSDPQADAKTASRADPSGDISDDYTFLVSLGDDNASVVYQPASGPQQAFPIERQRILISGWILPLFYGLLGASVYLMRTSLNDKTANQAFFPLILRIALGGIAGLAIGWFSVPASNTAALSTIPFGIAFLAGFSIDAVFTLFERLAQTISAVPQPRTAAKQRA
jgi:hypothetical protein